MAEMLRIILIGVGFIVATTMMAMAPSIGHPGPVSAAEQHFQEQAAWAAVNPLLFDVASAEAPPPATPIRR